MNHKQEIIVGSRGSPLALWQTEHVITQLKPINPSLRFSVRIIKTEGDQCSETPLDAMGDRGVFVNEIEKALLEGEIDFAVHSLKDMPSQMPHGVTLAAILERDDARDVLVTRLNCRLIDLPRNARIGTSSPRRTAQLLALRPDLIPVSLRGNVDTRLRKAETETYDGIILAAAGLHRLGLTQRITEYLPFEVCLPAPGQGALTVETRAEDQEIIKLVSVVDHLPTRQAVTAERALISALGAGCQTPVGAYASIDEGVLTLHAVIVSPDGSRLVRASVCGVPLDAEDLGKDLANHLMEAGALKLIDHCEGSL